jgi:hypothetical protein
MITRESVVARTSFVREERFDVEAIVKRFGEGVVSLK